MADYCGDARTVVPEILELLNPDNHNLFLLDPFSHRDINMDLVKTIAEFEGLQYIGGKPERRRPEILLNLPTNMMTLKRGGKESIDEFYGHEKWREMVEKDKEHLGLADVGLLYQVLDDMKPYYPASLESSLAVDIRHPQTHNEMYWLVLFSSHPLGEKIFGDLIGYARRFQLKDIQADWMALKTEAELQERGISKLDDFGLKSS